MRKTISVLLVIGAVALAIASEPIPVNTKTGAVEKTSSNVGDSTKPYDFTGVATTGIAGGTGSPGGLNGQFQYNNAGVFAGTSAIKVQASTVAIQSDKVVYNTSVAPTKIFEFDASGIGSGSTRVGTVPNANFTFLVPLASTSHLFVTGAGASGNLSTAQPAANDLSDLSAASRLIGSGSASAAVTQITVGTGLTMSGTTLSASGGAGLGDVVGPSSSVDNAVARYDGTTGKLIQSSAVTIDDSTGLIAGARFGNTGLRVQDTGGGEYLTITPGSNLSTNRLLTVVTGDSDRTLTFTGDTSLTGTNTGDQNLFSTIAVSGQSDVVADTTTDTLTLAAGSGVTLTTNASTDTVTIAATGGGSGTVTSVAATSPVVVSPSPIVGAGTVSLDPAVDYALTAAQTVTLNDGNSNGSTTIETLTHNTTGTPGNGLGASIQFKLESSTTVSTLAGALDVVWSDVTHASRTAYMDFDLTTSSGTNSKMRLFGSGGLSVNSTTDPGAGIVNANSGFKLGGAEFPIASNGLVKRTAANAYSAATAGTDYLDTTSISDTAYASTWNGVTTIAPSKNAVYDWGHTFDTDDDGFVDALDTQVAQASVTANTSTPQLIYSGTLQSSGTAATGLGTAWRTQLESSTTNAQDAGMWGIAWSDATHATRTAKYYLQLVNNAAALADVFVVNGTGSVGATTYELGGTTTTDTTLSRSAAGVLAVEGVVVPTISSTNTLTNKRITPRVTTITSNATLSPSADNDDIYAVSALATAITTISAPSGTPVDGQKLIIRVISDSSIRAISGWNAIYRFSTALPAPSTTVASTTHTWGFMYNGTAAKWDCLAIAANP